jgi:RNA polymerase-interacting CarD/CdnL/TRCF family regulator
MTDFKVGDYIVDFENIYHIYEEKNGFFFYHHLEGDKATSTSSLPKANLVKSGFRHLQTKEEIKQFFVELAKVLPEDSFLENKLIKESLYLDNPVKNATILKQLYRNKVELGEKFLKSNQEIINNITNHLAKEIAFVLKKPEASIQKQITDTLNRK